MEWLSQNWFWVVIGVLFVAMHLFGHGGHGGHGGGCGGGPSDDKDDKESGADQAGGHKH